MSKAQVHIRICRIQIFTEIAINSEAKSTNMTFMLELESALIDPINMKYIFPSIRMFLGTEFYVKMHL